MLPAHRAKSKIYRELRNFVDQPVGELVAAGLENAVKTLRVSSRQLRIAYHEADIFVLHTKYERLARLSVKASALGLPMLTAIASGADDMVDKSCGRVLPPGDLVCPVERLRWFDGNRGRLPVFTYAARNNA
jgi:hypothetical protein